MDVNFSNCSDEEIELFYKAISKNVKKFRLEKNITMQELSLDIGIKSLAFYSNCENNKQNKHFNLEHLYKISKTLNISFYELVKIDNL